MLGSYESFGPVPFDTFGWIWQTRNCQIRQNNPKIRIVCKCCYDLMGSRRDTVIGSNEIANALDVSFDSFNL